MKTTLKTLIAVAVTAVAAAVSTGASAASVTDHQQRTAQLLNVQLSGQDSHVRGVQRAQTVRGGRHAFGGRHHRHFRGHHRHHRGVGHRDGRGFTR